MKEFYLYRVKDESGVSGTGRVAHGVVFDDGRVAMVWLSNVLSMSIYQSIGDVKSIHGHEGQTEVRMEPDWKRAYNEVASLLENTTLKDIARADLPGEAEARKLLFPPPDPPKV